MPVAHTLEPPYAPGTLFLEIRRWFVEKLNVTFRFQFPDGSVGGDPWDDSIGPLVCVADVTKFFAFVFGALFGDNFHRTFSPNLCKINTILSRSKSYIHTKMDLIGNKPFLLSGLSMGIELGDNGCGCYFYSWQLSLFLKSFASHLLM